MRINVNCPKCDNSTVVTQEKDSTLGDHIAEFMRKEGGICNSFINGSAK